jgi:hypothetical protein
MKKEHPLPTKLINVPILEITQLLGIRVISNRCRSSKSPSDLRDIFPSQSRFLSSADDQTAVRVSSQWRRRARRISSMDVFWRSRVFQTCHLEKTWKSARANDDNH